MKKTINERFASIVVCVWRERHRCHACGVLNTVSIKRAQSYTFNHQKQYTKIINTVVHSRQHPEVVGIQEKVSPVLDNLAAGAPDGAPQVVHRRRWWRRRRRHRCGGGRGRRRRRRWHRRGGRWRRRRRRRHRSVTDWPGLVAGVGHHVGRHEEQQDDRGEERGQLHYFFCLWIVCLRTRAMAHQRVL